MSEKEPRYRACYQGTEGEVIGVPVLKETAEIYLRRAKVKHPDYRHWIQKDEP